MRIRIDEIVRGVPDDSKERVRRVIEAYRDRVRDLVKDAFLLSQAHSGRARHAMTVEIRDGAMDVLMEAAFEDDLGAALTGSRGILESCALALGQFTKPIPERLNPDLRQGFLAQLPGEQVRDVQAFVDEMLQRIDRAGVVVRILSVDEDVLGIYEPRETSGTIGIYWALLSLCAPRLGVSLEALAIKVLAHEYAHAFSHLGMDADGDHWGLDSYRYADRYVHEGLANFFSWSALRSSDVPLFQEALRALETIWPMQPSPYSEFDHWRRSGVAKERVRAAIREARGRHRIGRDDFRSLLRC